MWCGECPTSGLRMVASSLAIQYVVAPLLETMDLRGSDLVCGFWVAHGILEDLHLVGIVL